MRLPLLPLLLPPLAACNSLSPAAEPRVLIEPYLAIYELRGDLGMQDNPGTGPTDNASQRMRSLGQDQYNSDVGVRCIIGDGFGGLRIDYLHLSMDPTNDGVLTDNFGQLLAGDVVSSNATLDELRAIYLIPVWDRRTSLQDRPLDLKLALGGGIAHRDLELRASNPGGSRAQNVHIDDTGTLCGAVRFRAGWRSFDLDVDYALGSALGGDFDGLQHDFETRIAYTVPYQDVSLFAGYRYSVLPVAGDEGGLGFSGDLILDGFMLGVTVSF